MEGIDIAFIVFAVVCCLFFMFLARNSPSAETNEQKKPKTLTPAEREMQEQTKRIRKMYDLMWWDFMFGKKRR